MRSYQCRNLPLIIKGLKTMEEQEEYIIKDNVLRRHLTIEQRYILFDRLSRIYEKGRGGDRGNQHTGGKTAKDASLAPLPSVNAKTAQEIGVSERTIAKMDVVLKKADKDTIKKIDDKTTKYRFAECATF